MTDTITLSSEDIASGMTMKAKELTAFAHELRILAARYDRESENNVEDAQLLWSFSRQLTDLSGEYQRRAEGLVNRAMELLGWDGFKTNADD